MTPSSSSFLRAHFAEAFVSVLESPNTILVSDKQKWSFSENQL
jgi:hypothetical protein